MKSYIIFILYFLCSVKFCVQSDISFPKSKESSNQLCKIENSGKTGVCSSLDHCLKVQNELRQNIKPTVCYFEKFTVFVCCEINLLEPLEKKIEERSDEILLSTKSKSLQFCIDTYGKNFFESPPLAAVGGVLTRLGEYPFMVAIGWKIFENEIDFHCGGFLITKDFIITAAHCAQLGGKNPDYARIGGGNLNSSIVNTSVDISIEQVYVHPQYKPPENYNDIAIMKLSKMSNEKPACLWHENHDVLISNYIVAEAIGYGHTQFAGARSNDLVKVFLRILSNNGCNDFFKADIEIPSGLKESQLCAGDPANVMDTCQGDSGGPLLIKHNSMIPFVIGITSFGEGCANGKPSIYTRVSSYVDWIESIVWP